MQRQVLAIVVAWLALGSGAGLAQPVGEFFVDAKTHCKLWWPTKPPVYRDNKIFGTYAILSVKWDGTCARGTAQGRGTFEVVEKYLEGNEPRITTYRGEGDVVDGKLSGRGFYVGTYEKSPGPARIEGEFRDGVLNGRGFTSYDNPRGKGRSEGTYRDGKLEGWGTWSYEMVYEGKRLWSRFEGEFRGGRPDGRGVQTKGQVGCKAEERYEGEWKGGQFHGRGTLRSYDGKVYTGVWQEGTLDGSFALFELSTPQMLAAACR